MNYHENKSDRAVTRRRARTGTYTRTVINLTLDEERQLRRIADHLGMNRSETRKPSKAMIIAEMIRRLGWSIGWA